MLRNFQFIYTERDLLKAIIDGWVMAERVALSPLSGLICEIVNSVGQGNFTVVRKKAGKSQGISETSGCGNHSCILAFSYCEDLLRCWENLRVRRFNNQWGLYLSVLLLLRLLLFVTIQLDLIPSNPKVTMFSCHNIQTYMSHIYVTCIFPNTLNHTLFIT